MSKKLSDEYLKKTRACVDFVMPRQAMVELFDHIDALNAICYSYFVQLEKAPPLDTQYEEWISDCDGDEMNSIVSLDSFTEYVTWYEETQKLLGKK